MGVCLIIFFLNVIIMFVKSFSYAPTGFSPLYFYFLCLIFMFFPLHMIFVIYNLSLLRLTFGWSFQISPTFLPTFFIFQTSFDWTSFLFSGFFRFFFRPLLFFKPYVIDSFFWHYLANFTFFLCNQRKKH